MNLYFKYPDDCLVLVRIWHAPVLSFFGENISPEHVSSCTQLSIGVYKHNGRIKFVTIDNSSDISKTSIHRIFKIVGVLLAWLLTKDIIIYYNLCTTLVTRQLRKDHKAQSLDISSEPLLRFFHLDVSTSYLLNGK